MRLLLNARILLWALADDSQLTHAWRQAIEETESGSDGADGLSGGICANRSGSAGLSPCWFEVKSTARMSPMATSMARGTLRHGRRWLESAMLAHPLFTLTTHLHPDAVDQQIEGPT